MAAHKHAEHMALYAQDAKETEYPWERWQVCSLESGEWLTLSDTPCWAQIFEYRRKPQPCCLVDALGVVHEWPQPIKTAPEHGATLFYVDFGLPSMVGSWKWDNDPADIVLMSNGLLHNRAEDALQHARTLAQVNKIATYGLEAAK